ncbi:MAG: double zinc ribbon domain-containing protein [Syntrophomonadaceae bacterium]
MRNCPNCNNSLDKEYNFCPSCGFDLKSIQENNSGIDEIEELKKYIICDVCGEEVPEGSQLCGSCGAKITGNEKTVEKRVEKPSEKQPAVEKKPVSKEKAAVQKPQNSKPQAAAQKKAAPKKAPQQIPAGSGKKLSPIQLGVMIAGFLAVGVLIMWGAGVFGGGHTTDSEQQRSVEQPQQSVNPSVNLENVQRINELESAVNRDSTNLTTVLELAHLLNDSGLKERSVPYYQMYLRANPKNADVQVDLGVVYYEMQQFDMAKARMRKGLALNPRHQIANFNMGIVNLGAGSIDSAKIWWNKAVTIDPTSEIGKKAKELIDSHK